MSKEMVVSASAHDTKIAILEDGQVVEVYFERQQEYSLAGSIYKGRVTRILPGMQSAFVNIGLERDAFLYVSDFMEHVEEYDRVAPAGEERPEPRRAEPRRSERPAETEARPVATFDEPAKEVPAAEAAASAVQTAPPAQEPPERSNRGGERAEGGGPRDKHRRFSRRGRRHRGRERGLPESKYARAGSTPADSERAASVPAIAEEARPTAAPEPVPERILLPGESLAKYRGPSASVDQPPVSAASREDAITVAIDEQPSNSMGDEILAGVVVGEAAPAAASIADVAESKAAVEVETSQVSVHRADDSDDEGAALDLGEDSAEDIDSDGDSDRPVEITAEEAVESMREELMIEQLEEEAAEIADSTSIASETPSNELDIPAWMMMEDRVLDIIDDAEPDSPEAGVPILDAEGGFAAGSSADVSGDRPAASSQAAEAGGEPGSSEGSRQASVRERSGNPRYQRRQRWAARRQQSQRGERSERGGQQGRPGRTYERQAPKPLIGDMLKEGQEIIVQVAKEPLGKKGARITSHIALPGRYIVYMPTLDHTGVSRKISSDEERHRLKRIIVDLTRNLSGGFIVRTAGEGHSEEDIRQDVQFLVNLWADVKTKAEKSSAPALLHHDLDLTLRTLRDQLSDDFTTIWVDNEQAYEEIVSLVQKFQPALVHRVRLYTKDVPLFEETGVQDEINKALKPKVWLKSGGYIVINQTEALVAIDVNTGKYVGKSNRLEDTIVKTNVEAIQEIVRQIRLRDLGGIIVIDFIDMDERKNRQKVMSTLEDAMRADKAPSKILSFNEFGLLAITRKRVRQSLERTLCQPCAYCSGAGLVKSPETVSLEILAEARKVSDELAGRQVTLRVNPEVAKTLKERNNPIMEALEEITGTGVIIRGDAAVHIENFYFD